MAVLHKKEVAKLRYMNITHHPLGCGNNEGADVRFLFLQCHTTGDGLEGGSHRNRQEEPTTSPRPLQLSPHQSFKRFKTGHKSASSGPCVLSGKYNKNLSLHSQKVTGLIGVLPCNSDDPASEDGIKPAAGEEIRARRA